jgi:ribosomal protein S27E
MRGTARNDHEDKGWKLSVMPEMSASAAPVLFKAACPDCRNSFELPAAALRLTIGGSHKTTFYSFTCPECGTAVRKPAGERIVELLTGGGVRTLRLHTTRWTRPADTPSTP